MAEDEIPEFADEQGVTCVVHHDPEVATMRARLLQEILDAQGELNRLQAKQAEKIAEFARTSDQQRGAALELSLALAISKHHAEYRIDFARALTSRLPETLNAMRRGEIDAHKASKVYEPTVVLSDAQAREVDAIMVRRLAGKDPTRIRRSTNLVVARVDPDGHARRCRERRARRRVELIPLDDGMVRLSSDLPAEIGVAAYARIDTEARRRRKQDTSKTMDQHRADVLSEKLLTGSGVKAAPKAEVMLYMDMYTWLGLSTRPAEMAGYGIIPAWLARHIADGENTVLRRIITDPETGQIVSVGRNAYRAPADLARLIHARDRECRVPTCHRPAQACDLDHSLDWYAKHGETAKDNLISLCRRDHRIKDLPGWSHVLDKRTGRLTITTPTNHRYHSDPHHYTTHDRTPYPNTHPPRQTMQ